MGKEVQRAGLHRALRWIASDLRSLVDGRDFSSRVLTTLLHRCFLQRLAGYLGTEVREVADRDFAYRFLPDADALCGRSGKVVEKELCLLLPNLSSDMRARAHRDRKPNEALVSDIACVLRFAVGTGLEGGLKDPLTDVTSNKSDVTSNKLSANVAALAKCLTNPMNATGGFRLGIHEERTISTFGTAQEYLMTTYAASWGKSGAEFSRLQETSDPLACTTIMGETSVNGIYETSMPGWMRMSDHFVLAV